jgi:hypothetical protein
MVFYLLVVKTGRIINCFPLDVRNAFDLLQIAFGYAAYGGVGHIKAFLSFAGTLFQDPAFLNSHFFAREIGNL